MGFCFDQSYAQSVTQNLKFVALPVPEIIAIEVLGGIANPQSWGRRKPYGDGDGTVRKSIGEFL